jgi:hypothetical protein
MQDVIFDKEAIEILRSLSLRELDTQVIRPHFAGQGWTVVEEGVGFGCDLLLASKSHGEEFLIAVRVRAGENVEETWYVDKVIRKEAEEALRHRYGRDGSTPLLRYYWITTGEIRPSVREVIRERIDRAERIGGPVEVWGAADLYDHLLASGTLRHVGPLRAVYARSRTQAHAERGEGIFAAYWCYRALRLDVRRKPFERERAIESVTRGLAVIGEDPLRNLHYPRVLGKVFEIWRLLLEHWKDLSPAAGDDVTRLPQTAELLASTYREMPGLVWLLQDFDPLFQQLEQLELHYANAPSGLGTLEICRFLLRFGFPPTEPRIRARLDRAKDELARDQGRSIDGQCSLCTGSIVSCFSLIREQDVVEKAVGWLRSLREHRFCHLQPRYIQDHPADHHALHYTASVLQAILDFDPEDRAGNVPALLEPFFISDERESHGLYREWMLYRNFDAFEMYRQILATFLRYFLLGKELPADRRSFLSAAVADLITALKQDVGPPGREAQPPYQTYAGRGSLSCLALGLLLKTPGAAAFSGEVVRILHYRAGTAAEDQDQQLWDSSVERTFRYMRGYIDYWETVFWIKEQGRSVVDLLPQSSAITKFPQRR